MNNEHKQRWLALGLLVVVIGLFVAVVLVPLITTGWAYHDEKNDLLFRLQRQQKIAARRDVVSQALDAAKQQFQDQAYFSNRDTEALASADLQNIVKTAVTDAGGQLTSTQGLPGKTDNNFTRVAVRVRLTANIETLRTILLTISNSVPVLIIDQIDITPLRGTRNRPNNKVEPSAQLNVSFQVVSFMRGVKS
ncbi:general secretion pathway protein GspM [Methylomonas paludis]|uniref:General secretion pathway protein GspM n=1 Tax=Methylomonas paludis TaxID=1173101 RepID=A0A975MLQ2_9GAMM|nr:type II secretion system protein GspM [Methylomonas paludis]QWF69914.1 general secretion pathway protein GspM [Methylomonas paludis]